MAEHVNVDDKGAVVGVEAALKKVQAEAPGLFPQGPGIRPGGGGVLRVPVSTPATTHRMDDIIRSQIASR